MKDVADVVWEGDGEDSPAFLLLALPGNHVPPLSALGIGLCLLFPSRPLYKGPLPRITLSLQMTLTSSAVHSWSGPC